jgi:hypothetical protein
MRWLDTTAEDVHTHAISFWSEHREELQRNEFWADRIKSLKDDPAARLNLALDNLPLPSAFREAMVALRAIIRNQRKEGQQWHSSLEKLYRLAAYDSFGLDYAPRLKQPGHNVFETVPGMVVQDLAFTYRKLGYEHLRLLTATDVKWLVEAWGEPYHHTTLNELHRTVWDEYESKMIERQRMEESSLSTLLHQDFRIQTTSKQPKKQRKRWEFW